MKTVAVRTIKRTDPDTTKALGHAGVSTVHEAQGRIGLMKPYMRPIYAGAKVSGTAITVLAQPGDNWMLHVAIELCQPGDMLVVACTTDNGDGFFGDLLATSARARGLMWPKDRQKIRHHYRWCRRQQAYRLAGKARSQHVASNYRPVAPKR